MVGVTAEDLFTQEHRDYVDEVEDRNLRAELLHQLRLRDLLRDDRDSIERRCNILTEQVIKLKELLAEQEK